MIYSNRSPLLITFFIIHLAVPCSAQEGKKASQDGTATGWEELKPMETPNPNPGPQPGPSTGSPSPSSGSPTPVLSPEAKRVSAENTGKVGAKLLPESNEIGQTFGAALNPANSAIDRVPAVNAAAAQGAEISDTVQVLKAGNRISEADAAMLQALLQMQLLDGVESGRGGSSSQTNSSAQESDWVAPKTTVTGGFSAGESVGTVPEVTTIAATPSFERPSRSETELEPVVSAVSQPQAQIIRPDGTAIMIPNIVSKAETESSSARGISAPSDKLKNDPSSKMKEMMSDSIGLAYRANAAGNDSEGDPLNGLSSGLVPLLAKLGKRPVDNKQDPKVAENILGNTPDSGTGEKDPIAPIVARGPASENPEKTWPEWPEVFSDPKVFRDHFSDFFKSFSALSSAAKSKASEPEGVWAFILGILVGLIGVLKVTGFFPTHGLRHLLSNLPFGRKSDVQIIFPSSSEYRPRLIRDVRGWILNLHHRANNNLVAVGLLKEDAVVSADWLSPTIQNELNVEHGGEALRLRKGEFEKTSTPVNPAIRPFPEKIDFLMKSGLLRKKNNA